MAIAESRVQISAESICGDEEMWSFSQGAVVVSRGSTVIKKVPNPNIPVPPLQKSPQARGFLQERWRLQIGELLQAKLRTSQWCNSSQETETVGGALEISHQLGCKAESKSVNKEFAAMRERARNGQT